MTTPDPLADSASMIGLLFAGVVLITLIASNLSAYRDRQTNPLCALALVLALVPWALGALIGILIRLEVLPPGSSLAIIFLAGTGFISLGLSLGSLIVGIIGIVQFEQRDRFSHGLKRAISALVIDLVVLIFLGISLVSGIRRGGFPTYLARGAQEAVPAIVNEEWNFRTQPPLGWTVINPQAFGAGVKVAISRQKPAIYGLLTAERSPEAETALGIYAETIKGRLRSMRSTEIQEEGPHTVGGREGWWIVAEARGGGSDSASVHWLTAHHGVVYQYSVFGEVAERAMVRSEAEKVFAGFSVVDPKRYVVGAGNPDAVRFKSPHFGWSADFDGTMWVRPWLTLAADSPIAEWGLQNAPGTAAFTVSPFWLADQRVDLETLCSAYLSRYGFTPDGEGIRAKKNLEISGMRGREFDCVRQDADHAFVYRIRILSGRTCVYFLAMWMDSKAAESESGWADALDRVKFPETSPNIKAEDLTERERQAQAMLRNELGVALNKAGRTPEALAWVKRAAELSPDVAFVTNYADIALIAGRGGDALAFLNEQVPKFPGNQKLALKKANTLFGLGDVDGALRAFDQLFIEGFRDDDVLAGYAVQLGAHDRMGEAFRALDRYALAKDSPALRRTRASVLISQRDYDGAEKVLRELQKESPEDADNSVALAELFYVAQRYADSITECDKLIGGKRDTLYIYQRKGLAEAALKRYKDAKKSFEKALEKSPANAEVKKLLDQVSGMLGEGSNSTVKKAIDPVAIPKSLLTGGSPESNESYTQNYTAYYRTKLLAVECGKDKEEKSTEYVAVTVKDQRGVEYFSSLEFRFDPLAEEIYVNSLTVRDDRGKPVESGKVDDSYVVDDGVGETASQQKILHVPVPGLKPGYSFECTVTRRDNAPSKEIRFRSCLFSQHLPVLRSIFYVKAAGGKLKWEGTAGLSEPRKAGDEYTWVLLKPPVFRYEPLQAPLDKFLPMVWIGDAGLSWTGESKEYLSEIQGRLTVEPSLRSMAEVAVRGCATEQEKVQALARLVQKDLTYKAIEFGRRARMPNTTAQTLRNKYGDCKDHALLLVQMLESIGIEARLALVNSSADIRPKIPSLDQFDHVIVHLPKSEGVRFIDTTSKVHDLHIGPPPGLANRQVLVIEGEKPRLETIPAYGDDASRTSASREITFPNEADAEVVETLSFTGMCADSVRDILQRTEPADRMRQILSLMHDRLPSLELTKAEFENVDDPQQPLKLRLRYVIRQCLKPAGGELLGQLPAVWERIFAAAEPVESRLTPFRLAIPTRVDSHVSLTPPKGWQLAPLTGRNANDAFYEASALPRMSSGRLELTAYLRRMTGDFDGQYYGPFMGSSNNVLSFFEQPLVFRKALTAK